MKTIKTICFDSVGTEPGFGPGLGVLKDTEALSDVDAPLVITRLDVDGLAITHKTSGKMVYIPSSLAAARLALPELLKLTDWSVSAAELEKIKGLKARVEVVQDAANKRLEEGEE